MLVAKQILKDLAWKDGVQGEDGSIYTKIEQKLRWGLTYDMIIKREKDDEETLIFGTSYRTCGKDQGPYEHEGELVEVVILYYGC